MLKRLLFALLVCILGFAGSASAAKPRPKLSVKSVSSPPATAKAGDTFVFTVKVANKGDIKGKGRLKVSLRKTKNGPVAAALFSKRVKVPAKSKKSLSRTATVPALETGSYRAVACIKRKGEGKCRASKRMTIQVEPGGPGPQPAFTPGARSSGDSLFPQIGNGGYDAQNYDIELDYDPLTNEFTAGTSTTMSAVATQDLSQFSLDFQQLPVSQVLVDGTPASFTQEEARSQSW